MPHLQRSSASAWIVAVLAFAAAALARRVFGPQLFENATYLPFAIAILGVAWYGGLAPGLATTAATVVWALAYTSASPHGMSGENGLQLALFAGWAIATCLVCESLHASHRRLDAERRRESAMREKAEQQSREANDRYRVASEAIHGMLFIGCALDASRRQQSEESARASERHLRDVLDTLVAYVAVLTPDGVLVQVNGPALLAGGLSADEVLGKRFEETRWWSFSEESQARLRDSLAQAAGGRSLRYDVQVRVAGDEYWTIDFMLAPLFDDQRRVTHLIASGVDITALKKVENELRDAARRKDEFLAILAHELRNPLAPLRSGLQILKLSDEQPELAAEARDMMERQLNHLIRLVNDLLDVSRITRGRLTLQKERVELASVVRNAIEASRPLIDAQNQRLTVELPPNPIWLDADPTRLSQILLNLLNNAAKYSEKGREITLTAERSESDVIVSVSDKGIGIAPQHLPHIFEAFAQIESSQEKSQGGLGIGLSLVKGLVEGHGGSILAESAGLGQGSRFTIRMPITGAASTSAVVPPTDMPTADETPSLAETQVRPQPSGQSSGQSSNATNDSSKRSRRILVVDDNQIVAASLAMSLQLQGHEVRTAFDGEACLSEASRFEPDVILMDIGMPKLNGIEAARRLRERPGGSRAMLVAITGWGEEQDRRRSREAGFDFHLVKPVDPLELERLLVRPPEAALTDKTSQPEA